MKLLFALALSLSATCLAANEDLRPIIGILSMPNYYPVAGSSQFPASYVKWVESGGSRVVPIRYDLPSDEVKDLIKNLNGFLFTGGGVDFVTSSGELTQFSQTAMIILQEVFAANAAGEHLPLWATCLGFELVNFLTAWPAMNVLTGGFDSENYTVPLDFTAAAPGSRLFGNTPSGVYNIFATQPVTMNNHHSGVAPKAFAGNTNLTSRYVVLSTNVDRNGVEFVSSMEGITLPIYATQWHPEKVQFEWNPAEVINHSDDSVKANSYPTRFFIDEARKNDRHFPTVDAEHAALIYNYAPVFTFPKVSTSFQQIYFFST